MSLEEPVHSSTFYGCQLWCWNKCDLNRISVGWNNAVRRICGVGKRTSVGIMLHASELLPLVDIVRKRKLQFMSSLLESSNEAIKYVSSVLQKSTRSSFFSSIREIELLYGVTSRDSSWAVRSAINDFVRSSMSEDDTVRVDIATDWMRRPIGMFVEGFCQCSFLGISLCLLFFLCAFSLLHQVFLCVIQQ